jgi:hypothetical protein
LRTAEWVEREVGWCDLGVDREEREERGLGEIGEGEGELGNCGAVGIPVAAGAGNGDRGLPGDAGMRAYGVGWGQEGVCLSEWRDMGEEAGLMEGGALMSGRRVRVRVRMRGGEWSVVCVRRGMGGLVCVLWPRRGGAGGWDGPGACGVRIGGGVVR